LVMEHFVHDEPVFVYLHQGKVVSIFLHLCVTDDRDSLNRIRN
jgi:hypothetical protein